MIYYLYIFTCDEGRKVDSQE